MPAEITYTVDTGEKLVNETFGPNNTLRRSSGTEERRTVEISDGRGKHFSLDENGFTLVPHATAVRDFFDPKELERVYYPGPRAGALGAQRLHRVVRAESRTRNIP
ncbi:MAG: hypothetical protein ACT4P3_13945 [Betaproteobacteria bacterium]